MSLDGNSRELRLARRALRAAITHLRYSVGLTSTSDAARETARLLAIELERNAVPAVTDLVRRANEHLGSKRRERRAT